MSDQEVLLRASPAGSLVAPVLLSTTLALTHHSNCLCAVLAAVQQPLLQHPARCCQWLTECCLSITQLLRHPVQVGSREGDVLCKAARLVDYTQHLPAGKHTTTTAEPAAATDAQGGSSLWAALAHVYTHLSGAWFLWKTASAQLNPAQLMLISPTTREPTSSGCWLHSTTLPTNSCPIGWL